MNINDVTGVQQMPGNQEKTAQNGAVAAAKAKEIRIADMLTALTKHKILVSTLVISAAVLSGGVSLLLPEVYRANTVLLPPQQQQSSASALLSQLGGVAGMAAGMAGLKNPNELYVGMLKSRTVADKLIEKFELKQAYDLSSQDRTREMLAKNSVISPGKDGLITIQVEDTDKKLVAKLANGYVDELLRLTRVLAVTEASQRRVFFERQLELAKNNLVKAEVALKSSMVSNGVVSVDGESRSVIETIARLRAQTSAKEIELNALRAFVTPSHPDYRRAEEALSSLRSELAKLENGRGTNNSLDAAKQGGFDSIQRLRDLKYYQMLYELLAKQYEVARMDEAKDPSLIQVLDTAIEPEHHVRPKRFLMVLLGGFAGLFFGVMAVFIIEMRRSARVR